MTHNPAKALSIRGFWNRRTALRLAACVLVSLAVVLLIPNPAYASIFPTLDDFRAGINDLLFGWMYDMIEGFMNKAIQYSLRIAPSDILVGEFNSLLSSQITGASLYDNLEDICESLVVPLGNSILALVMLVQCVKISQRIDSTATLPAIKEIVFLAAFFMIFTWLINNSFGICAAAFEEINKIGSRILEDLAWEGSIDAVTIPRGGFGLENLMPLLFVSLLMFVGSLLGSVVSYAIGWARALQLYILATFSPIPFALMGFEETRSFGINFCKNFVAVCLAGAIMVVIMYAYPVLMIGCASSDFSNISDCFSYGAKALACIVMYIFALFKSGAWARDILGG